MIEELHQDLQMFVAGQFFVKIALPFLSLRKAAKFLAVSALPSEFDCRLDEPASVFFHHHFHWRSVGVSAGSIGVSLAVAAIFPTAKARS